MKDLPVHEAMKAAREEARWTQRYLAEVSGVGRRLLGNYEQGRVTPTIYNIIALADALGLTIDEYVGHRVKDMWAGKEV